MSTMWQHSPQYEDPAELIGFTVHARDGKIGSVDTASWETDTSHLVVDTGPWIFGSKVLIPAGLIESVDHIEEIVHLSVTKERVKNSPPFDPDRHSERGDDYWVPYEDYYGGVPPTI